MEDDSLDSVLHTPVSRGTFLQATAKAAAGLAAAGALAGTSGVSRALAAASRSPTTITFWFFDPWVKAPIATFERQHRTIKVNFILMGYVDNHQKLLTSLAAGSGAPDLIGIDIGFMSVFTAKGGLADLLKSPFNAGRFKGEMVKYKWAEGSSSDGRLVGMPWDIGPGGLWYRADLLAAAGIETDPSKLSKQVKTWDQLFALGDQLKKTGVKLFADPVGDIFNVGVQQQGNGWFKGEKPLIVQKAVKPLQRAVDAQNRGLVANLPQGSPEWATGIKNGAFATAMNACWALISWQRDFPSVSGKWRAIHAPGGDWAIGGGFLAIPEQSKQKEAAWEFAEYLTANKAGANVGLKTAGGPLPSYEPAWTDAVYKKPISYFGGQKVNELWIDVANHVPPQHTSPYDREANDIVLNEVTNALKLGKDPVKAMQDAQSEVVARVLDLSP